MIISLITIAQIGSATNIPNITPNGVKPTIKQDDTIDQTKENTQKAAENHENNMRKLEETADKLNSIIVTLVNTFKEYSSNKDKNIDELIAFIDTYYDNIISFFQIYDIATKKDQYSSKVNYFKKIFNILLSNYKTEVKEANMNADKSKTASKEIIEAFIKNFQGMIKEINKDLLKKEFKDYYNKPIVEDFFSNNKDKLSGKDISINASKENIKLSENIRKSIETLIKHKDNNYLIKTIANAKNLNNVIGSGEYAEYIANEDLNKFIELLLYNVIDSQQTSQNQTPTESKTKSLNDGIAVINIVEFFKKIMDKLLEKDNPRSAISTLAVNNCIIINILTIIDRLADENFSSKYFNLFINNKEKKEGIMDDFDPSNFTDNIKRQRLISTRKKDKEIMQKFFNDCLDELNINKDYIIETVHDFSYNEKLLLSNEILDIFKLTINDNIAIRLKDDYYHYTGNRTDIKDKDAYNRDMYNKIKNENNALLIKYLVNDICNNLKKQESSNENLNKFHEIKEKENSDSYYQSLYGLYFQGEDCITKELLRYIREKITYESMRYIDYKNYFNSLFIFIDEFLGANNTKLTEKFKDLLDKAKSNKYNTEDNRRLLQFQTTLNDTINAIQGNSYKISKDDIINKDQIKDKEINQILSFTFKFNQFIKKEKNISKKAFNLMNKKDKKINKAIEENIDNNSITDNLLKIKSKNLMIATPLVAGGFVFTNYNSKKPTNADKKVNNNEVKKNDYQDFEIPEGEI